LTKADGLAHNIVFSVLEDRSGNLWFGTRDGVSRYDGATWKTFPTPGGVAFDGVKSILGDRSGNLWFGTNYGGVSRYDGATWRTFTTADGLAHNTVNSIAEDRSGTLWFATEGGASRFDGTTWRTFTTADGLVQNRVISIAEDRSGNLWFGTYEGASRFDGATWRTFTTADGLADNTVTFILEDRSGALWFGTFYGGVSRFDGASWRTFTTADGLASDDVSSILEDRSGNLWFGTYDGGVSRFDGASWRTFTTADGLADNMVFSILEDSSGNLLLGTRGGVSRFDGSTWRTFMTADGLADDYVRSAFEDRSGYLWFLFPFRTGYRGVSRFDGATWRTFTTADGLAHNTVNSILEDRSGNLWFGTGGGVSRYDGTTWRTFTTADGLADNGVGPILEDRSGNLWFGTGGGVSRYDGTSWTTFPIPGGYIGESVASILEDRSGHLWLRTGRGDVSRYDGASWRTVTTADGLADNRVLSILEDRWGNLWFGAYSDGTSHGGVSRFDGASWRTFTTADGLADNRVDSIVQDRSGNLWFGTRDGVSRFDGATWRSFSAADGLAENFVTSLVEDRSGNLWFGAVDQGLPDRGGVSRYEPDRVPPQTVFLSVPPRLTATRDHSFVFVAAFGETRGIEFSWRLDAGPWSEWSQVGSEFLAALGQGLHVLEARCRDYLSNTDPTPARIQFEVDAMPPTPVIATPAFGEAVKGRVEVRGTAADPRFVGYRLEVRSEGAPSWDPPHAALLAESATAVSGGLLGSWDTSALPDGPYEMRLSITDSLGLIGTGQVTVIVDNHAPFADLTTPARVSATTGGDIYTTNSELHLYFPPRAFSDDAVVTILPAAAGSAPDTLASGAVLAWRGFDVAWGAAPLEKPARLEVSRAGLSTFTATAGAGPAGAPGAGGAPLASATLALYHSRDGSTWARLGGTVTGDRIEAPITEPGRYALFAESGVFMGDRTLSSLSFTPRVFSPTGGFADRQVGIGFSLGRPGPVTVRVYSRNGRLIRVILSEESMNAGANLVRWDGRDRDGGIVTDGIYLVTVEALGLTETKPLAVVK
jgi:ligand-binding sensor domain-containing protein